MQDMRWDKMPRGTSQEVQKMYFYGGNNLLAQTGKKKKGTFTNKAENAFNAFRYYGFLSFSRLQLENSMKHFILKFPLCGFFPFPVSHFVFWTVTAYLLYPYDTDKKHL